MNKLLLITVAMFSFSAFAEPVFKCKAESGKITYQNEECGKIGQTEEVEIIATDPAVIEIAREKLHKSVEEQTKLDAERAVLDAEQQSLEDFDPAIEEENNIANEEQQPKVEKKTYFQRITNSQNRPYSKPEHPPVGYQ